MAQLRAFAQPYRWPVTGEEDKNMPQKGPQDATGTAYYHHRDCPEMAAWPIYFAQTAIDIGAKRANCRFCLLQPLDERMQWSSLCASATLPDEWIYHNK